MIVVNNCPLIGRKWIIQFFFGDRDNKKGMPNLEIFFYSCPFTRASQTRSLSMAPFQIAFLLFIATTTACITDSNCPTSLNPCIEYVCVAPMIMHDSSESPHLNTPTCEEKLVADARCGWDMFANTGSGVAAPPVDAHQ